MSFYTSLSGLKAAQTDLSVISNNVANVSSTGFKKSRADFGDLVSSSALQSGSIAGQGVRLKAITQQFGQGGFASSERALDLAISGQGFFVTSGAQTGGEISYTRNGAFGVDANRYVTDSRGNYLQVLPVDTNGGVTATGLGATQSLQVPLTSGDAKATTTLNLKVNVPSAADLPANRTAYQSPNTYKFDRYDPNSYNYSAQTTVYDPSGNAQPATIYYTRTAAPSTTGGSTDSTWEARLFVGNTEASSTQTNGVGANPPVPLKLTFDSTGKITAPTGPVTFGAALPSGASAPISLTLDYGTETSQNNGTFNVAALTQDGHEAGQLSNVSVGLDGLVSATYSNGTSQKLGKVVIANFANPSGLRQMGDASWGASGDSGAPIVNTASAGGAGVIQSGALEQANVDITDELVALISAQRNFQANSKAISTANTLTQTIIQIN